MGFACASQHQVRGFLSALACFLLLFPTYCESEILLVVVVDEKSDIIYIVVLQ